MLLVVYYVICRVLDTIDILDVISFEKLHVECDAGNEDFECML